MWCLILQNKRKRQMLRAFSQMIPIGLLQNLSDQVEKMSYFFDEYSGRPNAPVRISGKQRSGGRKAPLEQLNCNAYPVGFPVKALPRQRCLQPLLERLQDIGFE